MEWLEWGREGVFGGLGEQTWLQDWREEGVTSQLLRLGKALVGEVARSGQDMQTLSEQENEGSYGNWGMSLGEADREWGSWRV